MEKTEQTRMEPDFVMQIVGFVLILASWFLPWVTLATSFFGTNIEINVGFWGSSMQAGGDSEFHTWFSQELRDESGAFAAGFGVVLGVIGIALTAFGRFANRLPENPIEGKEWSFTVGGAVAIASSALLVSIGCYRAFDSEVSMGDWEGGFWLNWIGAAIMVAAAVMSAQNRPESDEDAADDARDVPEGAGN